MRLRIAAAAALALICAATVCSASDSGGLDQLMQLLALRQHGQADLVEQHFNAMLDHPVESSGVLRYDAPDRLEKHTLEPHEESLVLAGGVLTVERGRSRRVLDLHSYPQALPFVESIRATLAGDRPALERVFHLDFTGELAHWSLALVPLDRQMAQSVAEVRIEGAQDQLLKVDIRQPDGDRSSMSLKAYAAP